MILVARVPNGLVRAQEVLLAVLDPDARLHPADRACEVALILLGRIAGDGHPQPDVAGNRMAAGITPTMVWATPLSLKVWPRTSGERIEPITPEALIDDDDPFGLGAILLGSEGAAETGRTPSTAAKSWVTRAPSMRSAP